jgi:diphosphomevalonate decarboxylase
VHLKSKTMQAVAGANIALVKYWGKSDAALNIPAVGSISVTLDHLKSTTEVTFLGISGSDIVEINGVAVHGREYARVTSFLDLIRTMAGRTDLAHVVSTSTVPIAVGLASSASGFAALATAASTAAELNLSPRALSCLARRGSGSAARSIFGGFVEMHRGSPGDDQSAYAETLLSRDAWPLKIVVVMTNQDRKTTSSSAGMELTASTSPYYPAWVETSPQDLDRMRRAIAAQDFELLASVTEQSCLKMHAVMLASQPGLLYWNGASIEVMHAVRAMRAKGIPACFTMDAGPQVKVICEAGSTENIAEDLRHVPGVETVEIVNLGSGVSVHEVAP